MPKRAIDIFAAWQGTFSKHNLFGRLCHIASWGVFSKKGMLEFLREMNYLSLKSNPFSFVPC